MNKSGCESELTIHSATDMPTMRCIPKWKSYRRSTDSFCLILTTIT